VYRNIYIVDKVEIILQKLPITGQVTVIGSLTLDLFILVTIVICEL